MAIFLQGISRCVTHVVDHFLTAVNRSSSNDPLSNRGARPLTDFRRATEHVQATKDIILYMRATSTRFKVDAGSFARQRGRPLKAARRDEMLQLYWDAGIILYRIVTLYLLGRSSKNNCGAWWAWVRNVFFVLLAVPCRPCRLVVRRLRPAPFLPH